MQSEKLRLTHRGLSTQQMFCEEENGLEQGEYDCCVERDSIEKNLAGCDYYTGRYENEIPS